MPDWLWIQNVVFPILGMGVGVLAMSLVYKTINRHLDRRHERQMTSDGKAVLHEIEDLRARVDVLELGAERLQELEERIDFTERMLAQQQHQQLDSRGVDG